MLSFCKNADISKIKKTLVLKGIFSETTYVCVRTKFQVSSVILTSFRQGGQAKNYSNLIVLKNGSTFHGSDMPTNSTMLGYCCFGRENPSTNKTDSQKPGNLMKNEIR